MRSLRSDRGLGRVHLTTTLLAVAVLLSLAACGSSSKDSSSSGTTAAGGGTTATTAAATAQLFADNFTSVCQGVGVSAATPYMKTAASHKALYIETFDTALQDDSSTDLPADWTVQFDPKGNAYKKVDLVGCAVRTASTFIKTCTGYQDNGKDTGQTVKLYSATYKVTVREATTGTVLATTTMSSKDDTCPLLQSFDQGQKTANSYGTPSKDAVVAFLKPFVQPS